MPRKKSYNSEYFPDLDKPYRRGLILGLSLAEVFLLLVFLLLLVAVGYAGFVEDEKKKVEKELAIGEEVVKHYPNILPEEIDDVFFVLKENLVDEKDIDKQLEEIFKKIKTLEEENLELKAIIEQMVGEGDEVEELLEILSQKNREINGLLLELEKLKKKLQELIKNIEKLEFKNSALQSKINELEEKIKKLEALIDKNLSKLLNEQRERIKKLEQENKKLEKENKDLIVENSKDKDVQEELIRLVGDGTQKIACWTKFDEGLGRLRSLNIFDILINNSGILIHNRTNHKFLSFNELNERKNKIPISRIEFNRILSISDFLFQTDPMYRHGLDKKGYFSDLKKDYVSIPCLYNVQVYDNTTNDTRYREIIENGLSQRFNLIILRNEQWPH